ncbi:E3 ubiquitin-protein ligase AIRP2-like [Triticum dicoccoides]|uniref:E3 ubiquitin-protein ligase AIRP2-like n=1 Tax=Triticum dicoccoides TaxID=85692 RepID=UPI00188ECD55|nr:E3 ubiquitin-protein ligase AIRP2-like [Triticum dicoccoides]
MQLEHGMSDSDDRRQRAACAERYRRRDEPEDSKRPVSEMDAEIEEECGICMELNSRVMLRNCIHDMCIKCYHQCQCLQCGRQRVHRGFGVVFEKDKTRASNGSFSAPLLLFFLTISCLPAVTCNGYLSPPS